MFVNLMIELAKESEAKELIRYFEKNYYIETIIKKYKSNNISNENKDLIKKYLEKLKEFKYEEAITEGTKEHHGYIILQTSIILSRIESKIKIYEEYESIKKEIVIENRVNRKKVMKV